MESRFFDTLKPSTRSQLFSFVISNCDVTVADGVDTINTAPSKEKKNPELDQGSFLRCLEDKLYGASSRFRMLLPITSRMSGRRVSLHSRNKTRLSAISLPAVRLEIASLL